MNEQNSEIPLSGLNTQREMPCLIPKFLALAEFFDDFQGLSLNNVRKLYKCSKQFLTFSKDCRRLARAAKGI